MPGALSWHPLGQARVTAPHQAGLIALLASAGDVIETFSALLAAGNRIEIGDVAGL